MALGGGFGGAGGGFAAQRAASAPGRGLPFGGIPSEMQAGVERLLVSEPDHGEADVAFTYQASAAELRPLTLRGLLVEHWRLGVLALVLVVVVAVFNQAGPRLIDLGITEGMVGHRDMAAVAMAAGLYLAAIAVTALAQRWQVKVTGRLAAGVMYDLRVRVFAHLQRLGLDFFTDEKAGVVMTRMTADIENLQQLLQDGLAQLCTQGLTMVVIAGLLLSMDVELALVTLALTVPVLTAMSLWFRRASELGYQRVRDGIANVLADLSESLHGVRVVTAHNRQRHNIVHHRNVTGAYRDANVHTARINAVYGPGTQMLGYLASAGLLAVGGSMVANGTLPPGALVAFFLYMNRFLSPIQLLVQQYNTYQQGTASVTKLRTLFAVSPNVPEDPEAIDLPPVVGRIEFDHVGFGYHPEEPVLHDVDLVVEAGETVALVGPTGAGKSTLAKLVTRSYDPTQGRVLIDGHDLRSVSLRSLRTQLGVVPQEPFLFAGTVRDNVAFARPGAGDEEVWAALQAVGLADVVERLPDGLDTVVHERGQSLSSGERQLLALARAFMARPRVLVLDEATSNLDMASEAKIEAALDTVLRGRTAVLVAHRLTTAMKADRIVVVVDGRVAEIGSHDQLVAQGGRYAAMFAAWERNGASPDAGRSGARAPGSGR